MIRSSYFVLIAALGAIALLASVSDCHAQNGDSDANKESFYVGIGIGAALVSDYGAWINDSGMAYRLLAGYQLNDFVAFEASVLMLDDLYGYYPFSVASQHAVADGQSVNTGVTLLMPVAERLRVFGKAGVNHWSSDASDFATEDSGTDISIGIGIDYRFGDALAVGLDYELNRFGEADIYIGALSLRYRF